MYPHNSKLIEVNDKSVNVKSLNGQVTEVRVWTISLNSKIIKENMGQPLGIVNERRAALRVKIRKEKKEEGKKGLRKLGGKKDEN